jgi:hypothetical protein
MPVWMAAAGRCPVHERWAGTAGVAVVGALMHTSYGDPRRTFYCTGIRNQIRIMFKSSDKSMWKHSPGHAAMQQCSNVWHVCWRAFHALCFDRHDANSGVCMLCHWQFVCNCGEMSSAETSQELNLLSALNA